MVRHDFGDFDPRVRRVVYILVQLLLTRTTVGTHLMLTNIHRIQCLGTTVAVTHLFQVCSSNLVVFSTSLADLVIT